MEKLGEWGVEEEDSEGGEEAELKADVGDRERIEEQFEE